MGQRFHALMSYFSYRTTDVTRLVDEMSADAGSRVGVFADSGAFSAHMAGKPIDVGAYADWLEQHRLAFNCYASLDVIGDYQRSLLNQQELERRGLAPMPVWHAGEPIEVLRDYCQGYRYIAIGGLVANAKNLRQLAPHLVGWFRLAAEYNTALHGFGMTTWECISSFPWYSVDSSSPGSAYRYGTMSVFDERLGRFEQVRLYDRQAWGRVGVYARALGLDPEVFIDRQQYRAIYAVVLSFTQWWNAERFLRQKHGEQPVDGGGRKPDVAEPSPGLHLYIADGHLGWIRDGARLARVGRWDEDEFKHRLKPRHANKAEAC